MAMSEGLAKQTPLRILAFGDSLTAGYYQYGFKFRPYARNLTDLLQSVNISADISERGNSGERVVPAMVRRLNHLLQKEGPYDWIIILGGTNDLGSGTSAERIFNEGLQPMYETCLNSGGGKTKLAAMTVIENSFNAPTSTSDKQRQLLNTMIRDYVAQNKNQDRICLVDLDKGIPYHSLNDQKERDRFWDDGLHLKPAGYDLMGKLIFDVIKSKI